MKRTFSTLTILLLCATLVSAQDLFVKKRDLNPALLSKNGVYYSIENTGSDEGPIFHYMFFYADGTFYIGGHSFDSTKNMIKVLDAANDRNNDEETLILRDAWGSYYVCNDTIYMERFSYTRGNEYSSHRVIMLATIQSDTSFHMIKQVCEWCGINEYYGPEGHIFDVPFEYHFHPLKRLPDPSEAWFRRKPWFIQGGMVANRQ